MNKRVRRRRLIFAAMLTLAVGLIVADTHVGNDQNVFMATRSWVGNGVGPMQKGASVIPGGVNAIRRAASALTHDDAGRIAELEKANTELQALAHTSGYDRERAAELDKLLHVAGLGRYRVVPARVVAVGSSGGFARSVSIDVGSVDGIEPNQTVLNGAGLVGRVTSVSRSTSTVALLIDAGTTVGIRLENMQSGFTEGGGGYDQPLAVDLFNPNAPVAVGDRLVSFGSPEGRPYVPGVPVGQVTAVEGLTGQLTKRVQARPFVDFAALNLVGVVVEPPRVDPRLAVLPDKPHPTPTPTVTVTLTAAPPTFAPPTASPPADSPNRSSASPAASSPGGQAP